MTTCLLLYYSILLNLSPTPAMAVCLSVPFYSTATVPILTLSALTGGFLAVSYLVISTTFGESLDANTVHPTDLPLLFRLYIFFGMILIGYPRVKLVEFHHSGFHCFGLTCSGQKGLLHLF